MEVAKLNLTLGSAQREFLYRKGTIDEAVIFQVLKTSACSLGRLRRGAELAMVAEQLATAGKPTLIVDVSAKIGAAAVFFAHKFPMARIVALETDAANFQLLTANTAGLPIECVRAAPAGEVAGSDTASVTIDALYDRYAQEATPFIVKLEIEKDIGLVARDAGWIARTPVIVAALSDYLIPGTANSRAFVEAMAHLNRDVVYLRDNVFSVIRVPASAAA